MECYYIIKLPNGGEAKIPANLTTLDGSDDLESLFNEYKELQLNGVEEDEDKIVKLKKEIRSKTETGQHHNTIYSIMNSAKSYEEYIKNINEAVGEELTTSSIQEALFKHLQTKEFYKRTKYTPITVIKKGKSTEISLEDFYKEVSNTISKRYFKEVNVETLLNVQTGNDMLLNLTQKMVQNRDMGISYGIFTLLEKFIYRALSSEEKDSKIFFNTTFKDSIDTSVVIENESTGHPIIFYNDSSELSMFLGVFSYAASKLSEEDLIAVLKEFNNNSTSGDVIGLEDLNIKDFFLGQMTKEGFIEPEFKKLLNVKYGKDSIDRLINLVVDTLPFGGKNIAGPKAEMTESLRVLFGRISPKYGQVVYGKNNVAQLAEEREYREHIEKKVQQLKHYFKRRINPKMINYYYSVPKMANTESVDALQNDILNNVELYKDVIVLPNQGTIIPTSIVKVKNGLVIRGFKAGDDGVPIDIPSTGRPVLIKKGQIVKYRKYHDRNVSSVAKDMLSEKAVPLKALYPDKELLKIDLIQVLGKSGAIKTSLDAPPEFIRSLIKRGSEVTYTFRDNKTGRIRQATSIVKLAAPGVVIVNGFGKYKEFAISYGDIEVFNTLLEEVPTDFIEEEWVEKEKVLNSLHAIEKTIDTDLPIKKGDIIKTTYKGVSRYNKVLAVTNTHAFILTKVKMKESGDTLYKAMAVRKDDVETLYVKKLTEFDVKKAADIIEEYINIYLDEQSIRSLKVPLSSERRDAKYSYFTNYEGAMDGDFIYMKSDKNNGKGATYKILDKNNRYVIGLNITGSNPYKTLTDEDIKGDVIFITERDISSIDSLAIANMNSFFLLTADSTEDEYIKEEHANLFKMGYTLSPASYVIPKQHNSEDTQMGSGNLTIGSVRFGAQLGTVEEGFDDVTNDIIDRLNQRSKYSGKNLYMFQLGDGYIKRYNGSLHEYRLQDENGQVSEQNYPNKYIEALTTNVYLGYAKKWKGGKKVQYSNKMYKIISVDGDTMILEYSGTTNGGKYITIRKRESIQKAFDQKKFKSMYIKKTSNVSNKLFLALEREHLTEDELEKEELIHRISNRLKNIFRIETIIRKVNTTLDENAQYRGKKAWIEPSSDPNTKPTVVFNIDNENSSEKDVLHEYLHLVLIALRYSSDYNASLYEKIIMTYKKNKGLKSDNLFEIEESLVNNLSGQLVNKAFIDEDKNFKELFTEAAIKGLQEYTGGKSITIHGDNQLEDILHLPMKDLFKSRTKVVEEMKNANVVFFDASFRGWLDENIKSKKLKIKC